MEVLWKEFSDFALPIGESIKIWARPNGWQQGPTSTYFGAGFDFALAVVIGYLAFVLFGSLFMLNTKWEPKEKLYPAKFLYNMVQVMLCSYMCIEACVQAFRSNYSILPCQPFDQKNPPIAFILWVFYLSKILDFLDTVFIILSKSWKQLSFLHVYHHTSIFLFYWLNLNEGYDGDVYLTIVLNGFIHTVMYTYYFVSLHTDRIWWKSALTMCQMIQFIIMNAQAIYLIFYEKIKGKACNQFPINITSAYLVYIVSLLILFANFFVASYVMKPKGSTKGKSGRDKSVKASNESADATDVDAVKEKDI